MWGWSRVGARTPRRPDALSRRSTCTRSRRRHPPPPRPFEWSARQSLRGSGRRRRTCRVGRRCRPAWPSAGGELPPELPVRTHVRTLLHRVYRGNGDALGCLHDAHPHDGRRAGLGANGAAVRARRAGDRVHARRRGACPVRRGLRRPRRRCRRGDRHVLRQVHGPAGRGRAEHRQRAVHHRPPPRIRGAPGRLGIPRHHHGRSAHRTLRHPADLPAHAGCHRSARQRRGDRGQIAGGGTGLVARRCGCCSSTAVTPTRPHSGTSRAGPSGWRPAAGWSSTTCSPTPTTVVRRRTGSTAARWTAEHSRRFRRRARCGCCERVSGEAGEPVD